MEAKMNGLEPAPTSSKKKEEKVKKKEPVSIEVATQRLTSLVLKALGNPPNLSFVRTKTLWSDRWRVDVFCTFSVRGEFTESEGQRIPHSYFIRYDREMNEITYCNPPIEKEYE